MTSPRPNRRVVKPFLVAAVMLVAFAYPNAASAADTLYAATGASCNPGTLYTLNSSNGAATQVANITIGPDQVSDLTGLAIDPTTDTMYGWLNDDDCNFDSGTGTLITINKSTGAATVVGIGVGQMADITFDRFGNLYGFSGGCGQNGCNEGGADLYTINKGTGATTKVSESGLDAFRNGLASDSNGHMYMKSDEALFRINPFTGHAFAPVGLVCCNTQNILAFGPSDVLYTGRRAGTGFQLMTLNKTTGATTNVGAPNGVFNVSAIDWDFDTPTTPGVADVSLTNTPSTPTPTVGGSVTFSVHVANAGLAVSTISVKNKLPSGFTYVSDTPSTGSYDPGTGIWSVGSLGSGGSADLDIVATANATGNHTDNAEVVSTNTYDPDSVPGSGEGDTFAAARAIPATSPVFYAVSGAGTGFCVGTPSFLYEIDTSGGISQIAPITIGGNQVNHVLGLAVDPDTGTLFGYMNTQSPDCAADDGTLITINKDTGVATRVGSEGDAGISVPDMTSDPFGTLYAWDSNGDDLYTLDKAIGTSSLVGECGCGSSQTGLADDSLGRLYMKSGSALFRVNQFSGELFGLLFLSQQTNNMLAFGPSDVLYTGSRTSTDSGVTDGFELHQIDLSTGTVTLLGSNSALHIGALAWDLRTYTAPDEADLSLTKDVDDSTPDNWFQNVTFTITVDNDGPDDATGVEVTDNLPSGLSWVSDDSGGDYNPSTGVWDVGTITSGNSATLEIVASVQPSGSYTNAAEVTDSTTYDTDSVPASGSGEDDYDSETLIPSANPGVNAAADVIVSGPSRVTNTSKSFTVKITNVGTVNFTATQNDIDATVNGSSVVTCSSFSQLIKPGRSYRAKCSANLDSLPLSPGDSVTYSATLDVAGDGFTNNDDDSEVRTAS